MVKKTKTSDKFDDATSGQIIKKYGDVVRIGTDVFEETKNLNIIPVSPNIDMALGGGFREGTWVVLSGDPKTGKTTTALQFAANCQKKEHGSRKIIYVNVEGRLSAMNFEGVHGLDASKITVVESSYEPLSAEEYLDIIEQYVKQEPESIIIVDSTSSLLPERELNDSVSGEYRAGLPKLLANFTKKLGGVVTKQKAIIILITHFIANTSGRGYKQKLADGGNMIQYQAQTNVEVKYTKPWEVSGRQIGQMVVWKIICSSAGGFPGGEAQSWLRYGHGLDYVQELIHSGCELGLVSKSGAWYTCNFALENLDLLSDLLKENEIDPSDTEKVTKFFKFQGQERLRTFISENPKLLEIMSSELRDML